MYLGVARHISYLGFEGFASPASASVRCRAPLGPTPQSLRLFSLDRFDKKPSQP